MTSLATQCEILPARRRDLVIRPLGEAGRYVVKDLPSGADLQLRQQERLLLEQLDGQQDAEGVCSTFATRFGEPLSTEDLDQFIALAQSQGLLQARDEDSSRHAPRAAAEARATPAVPAAHNKQSLLHWRRS